jgi:hypothetical protein
VHYAVALDRMSTLVPGFALRSQLAARALTKDTGEVLAWALYRTEGLVIDRLAEGVFGGLQSLVRIGVLGLPTCGTARRGLDALDL